MTIRPYVIARNRRFRGNLMWRQTATTATCATNRNKRNKAQHPVAVLRCCAFVLNVSRGVALCVDNTAYGVTFAESPRAEV